MLLTVRPILHYADLGAQFNRALNWDTSHAQKMDFMFAFSDFNRGLAEFIVKNVTNFTSMFEYSSFNHDISSWNVSMGKDFEKMFYRDFTFNQDMNAWGSQLFGRSAGKNGTTPANVNKMFASTDCPSNYTTPILNEFCQSSGRRNRTGTIPPTVC
jgi:hypothetical protein